MFKATGFQGRRIQNQEQVWSSIVVYIGTALHAVHSDLTLDSTVRLSRGPSAKTMASVWRAVRPRDWTYAASIRACSFTTIAMGIGETIPLLTALGYLTHHLPWLSHRILTPTRSPAAGCSQVPCLH